MSELTIATEHLPDLAAYVLRPTGEFTTANRHALRRSVQKHLAAAPAAIIVDLSDVQLPDRIVAATFIAIRRDAADALPGVALLLCGVTDAAIAKHLQTLLPRQPIFKTLADAIQGIGAAPTEGR
jgi:anti-anti-sigma regulatory factor